MLLKIEKVHRYIIRETRLNGRILLAVAWQILLFSTAGGQPQNKHSAYFEAALTAKTPNEAALYVQKAATGAIQERQYARASHYYFRMTETFYEQQHYLVGIRHAQRGIQVARQYGLADDTLSFQYYGLLASMYSRLSMNDSARYWYGQTEQLLRLKPALIQRIPGHVDAYYYNKSVYYLRLGDQEQAALYIRKSVELVEKMGNKRSAALSYLQVANYYFGIYQYSQAATYYRKARNGFSPGSVDACWGDALLGNCFRAVGNTADGLKWLRDSKKKYVSHIRRYPDKRDINYEVESSYYLAKCEQLAGLDKDAMASYRTCIDVYQRAYSNRGELMAASWSGLGSIALKNNRLAEALASAQQALRASTVVFDQTATESNPQPDDIKAGQALYEALRLKGRIWFTIYKQTDDFRALERAIHTFQTALQVAQHIRRSFTQLESAYFFNQEIRPCVEQALEAIFELPPPSQSRRQATLTFDLLQAYQAMGLADALHEKTVKHETIPAVLLQQEQDLRQQLTSHETRLLGNLTARERAQTIDNLDKQKQHLLFFTDQLAQKYPRYHALKYIDRPLPVGTLQQRLNGQTAYVSYFLGDRFVYGFLATHARIQVFRQVMSPVFGHSVTDLRREIERNPGMFAYEGRPAANRLFDYLIRPIEPELVSVRRLIVERDGVLNYIPFEVLENASQPESYLCKRVALSYSYSARLTFIRPASPPDAPLNPAGFAPYSEDPPGRGKATAKRWLLPRSGAEIQAAGGRVYVNAQATKTQLLRTIPTVNVLHLATHAHADDMHPEASAIRLYPDKTDSLLRASEIVNLSLDRIRLVVLSACEGNRGVLRKAEGLLSLARAFRLAGCPTILTTTWSAHNETTGKLAGLFYRRLHQGLSADVALQQARLDYFESPMYQKWGHPYHWANFTLIGNPDVAFPAPGYPWGWLAGGLMVLLVSGRLLRWLR